VSSSPAKEQVLLRFANGQAVSTSEFLRVYQKNQSISGEVPVQPVTKQSLREYLDVYVAFRRKVMEAEREGLDTSRAFAEELRGYVKQLAATYLIDRSTLNSLVDEAHRRDSLEVTASHLLITCAMDASPADTQRAYSLLTAVRDSITRGLLSFEQAAKRHSQDRGAAANGGSLGTFSALDMIYSFEKAAYTTPEGTVSQPVRTRYGYHLVYVEARKPKAPQRPVAHLFVGNAQRTPELAKARIDSLLTELTRGADFGALVASCSDDKSTAGKGGDLGTVRLIPALESAKRALADGQYSAPVRSQGGWHVLRVGPPVPARSATDIKRDLKQRISRDERFMLAEQALVQRLLREYGYRQQPAALKQLAAGLGGAYLQLKPDSVAKVAASLLDLELAQFAGRPLRGRDLLNFRAAQPTLRGASGKQQSEVLALVNEDLGRLAKQEVLAYEERQLASKYPDYAYLAQEYRDGLLLFSLMDKRVWRRAVEDTLGLKSYHAAHPDSFLSGPRISVRVFGASDSAQAVAACSGTASNLSSSVDTVWAKPSEAQLAQVRSRPGVCLPGARTRKGWEAVQLISELPPATLTYREARADVVRAYQRHLEIELMSELAARFAVTINEAAFDAIRP
jgi:peptidyl-prolyl cis-trans isomerase SurA